MKLSSAAFAQNAVRALRNAELQQALGNVPAGFQKKLAAARTRLPEFDVLRDEARKIKDHALAHLDVYLEEFERRVQENGGHVHWCRDGAEATEKIVALCREMGARTVTKGKSMVAEEIALNEALEKAGIVPLETDLGEYVIQLRNEPPSHIVGPAIHLNLDQWVATFKKAHTELDADRHLDEPRALTDEARQIMRRKFLAADAGITGANFLIAESGTTVTVTNEGNADLTQTLPPAHIVVASVEKIVPTLEDAMTLVRVLARSATGQDISVYTTFSTGSRRPGDLDGPKTFHVVLIDGGRSRLLAGKFRDMLRCIRCGACMNHCPVYASVGGHAYGWVYPGPMGAVLTPALAGIENAAHLPNASTFCGRCEAVCPVGIPLPKLMRYWREEGHRRGLDSVRQRLALRLWRLAAERPALWRILTAVAARTLAFAGQGGGIRRLPFAGGWAQARDMPAPEGTTFMAAYKAKKRR